MEVVYWQRCEPSQSLYMRQLGGMHGGINPAARDREHKASLEKNSHGVETYKFFQNWLRVPGLGAVFHIYCTHLTHCFWEHQTLKFDQKINAEWSTPSSLLGQK